MSHAEELFERALFLIAINHGLDRDGAMRLLTNPTSWRLEDNGYETGWATWLRTQTPE